MIALEAKMQPNGIGNLAVTWKSELEALFIIEPGPFYGVPVILLISKKGAKRTELRGTLTKFPNEILPFKPFSGCQS